MIASESDVAVCVLHNLDSHGSFELGGEWLKTVWHVPVKTVFPFLDNFYHKELKEHAAATYLIWFADSAGVKTE